MTEKSDGKQQTVVQKMFKEEALMRVNVKLSVVLGRQNLRICQLLKLGRGAVIELNQHIDDSVEVLVNEVPIAKGEVVIDDDNGIGVKISELLMTQQGDKARAGDESDEE
ncbi:MAG: FliM/FliN family flagellar motor switch protein [Alphaproteobacteria bacterium]|nr:FliM/FliN family flagellar motor switch protein [Alphaproteobacteria bacterium]